MDEIYSIILKKNLTGVELIDKHRRKALFTQANSYNVSELVTKHRDENVLDHCSYFKVY